MEKKRKGLAAAWYITFPVLAVFALVFSVMAGSYSAQAAKMGKKDDENSLHPYSRVEDGYSEMSGVTVETTTDKEAYKADETAVISMKVTNNGSNEVTDLKVRYSLPSNFKAEKSTESIDTLAAGETKTFTLEAVVTEDEEAPLVEGAYNSVIVVIVVAVIVVLVILILLLSKKKGGKKAMSLFMAVSLAMGGLAVSGVHQVSATEELSDGAEEDADSASQAQVTTETGNYEVAPDKFVSRVSVHDPSVVKDPKSGMYYIFGSHLAFAKSEDLMEWQTFRTNIHTDYAKLFKEPWNNWSAKASPGKALRDQMGGSMMWAPDVIWNDTMNKWCMYMSINGDNWVSSICLLTADDIEGPYKYEGIVVYSGMNNPNHEVDESTTDIYKVLDKDDDLDRYKSTSFSCINAIDPNVQYDDNGDLYMTYGSWSAGIFQLKLDKKTGLRDYETKYETERNVSDAYLGIKIAGGFYSSGEAPYLLKSGKYYYLFLSYAGLNAAEGYQMRIYRSENISGPYVDQNGDSAILENFNEMKTTPLGLRIFDSYDMYGIEKVQVAQGHNSAFVDDDGKIYLVYHTRFQSDTGEVQVHQVRVHQLFVNEDDWLVAAPYEYSGETLPESGYAMEDMAGTYEFIYHEPTQSYMVVGGKQLGIVGRGTNGRELDGTKDIVIGRHVSTLSYSMEFVVNGAAMVTLNEDGTVTGEYKGTWSNDGAAVTIKFDNGVEYKGYFVKQANETMNRDMTMTFTAAGGNVEVWGIKALVEEEPEPEEE